MDVRSEVDPWYLLAPTRILEAWFGVFDFDLHHGKVVHDYLADDELWTNARSAGGTKEPRLARKK